MGNEAVMPRVVCFAIEHTEISTPTDQQAAEPVVDTIPYPRAPELWWPEATLPRYPRDVSPTLLLEFEEQWLRGRFSAGDVERQLKVMLVCAIYRSHDPLLIQWRTGLPAAFVDSVLAALSVDVGWPGADGYERLAADLRRFSLDDVRADQTLGEVLLDLGIGTAATAKTSVAQEVGGAVV